MGKHSQKVSYLQQVTFLGVFLLCFGLWVWFFHNEEVFCLLLSYGFEKFLLHPLQLQSPLCSPCWGCVP